MYAYLLAMYLGDGAVIRHPRTYRLVVALDAAYPSIVSECLDAVHVIAPSVRPSVRPIPDSRCTQVTAYWSRWPAVFPQHGPGRKHERPIVREPWQRGIVVAPPQQFLRGLIHSDGCRCVNRFKTKLPSGRVAEYAYPRYFFSNLSADIRGLFCAACDQLGIRWSLSNPRNVSVSHRRSVAILDEFVGPKC